MECESFVHDERQVILRILDLRHRFRHALVHEEVGARAVCSRRFEKYLQDEVKLVVGGSPCLGSHRVRRAK